jgi:hypothetical protein
MAAVGGAPEAHRGRLFSIARSRPGPTGDRTVNPPPPLVDDRWAARPRRGRVSRARRIGDTDARRAERLVAQ